MKILFRGSSEEKKEFEESLRRSDFQFVQNNEDYQIRKATKDNNSLIGQKKGNYHIIYIKDIIYIESFDHAVICHTVHDDFELEDKLFQIAGQFEEYGLIRVHKSYVVNKQHIKTIIPEINRKFTLLLINGSKIQVSRHFFSEFKEHIGMKVKQ